MLTNYTNEYVNSKLRFKPKCISYNNLLTGIDNINANAKL
jgi:hypothetical protein